MGDEFLEKLILIGAHEVAREVRCFVEKYSLYEIVGYSVHRKFIKENTIDGLPVIPLEELDNFINRKTTKVFISISWGQRLNQVRKDIFNDLKAKGYSFANIIAPQAVIHTDKIGEGNWFHEYCYIGHQTVIGDNNDFRPFSTIGHYTNVGSHNHFSKCTIGGIVCIGDCNFIGMQAIVYNRIMIGTKNFIGAGTVVKKSIGDYSLVAVKESPTIQLTEKQIEKIVIPGGSKNFLS